MRRWALLLLLLRTRAQLGPPAAPQNQQWGDHVGVLIEPSDASPYDYFGDAVAASGEVLAVGAWKDDDNGMKNSGAVYLFRISPHNAAWQQLAKLTASDAGQDDHFGRSVAIDGGVVAVGAYYDDDAGSASGSVYLFKYDGSRNWPQVAKLTAGDAAAYDQFGRSLAISGGVVAVGAHYDDDAGSNSGAVYVFRTDNGGVTWPQVAKLKPHDASGGDQFGNAVAMSGAVIAVAAPRDAGAVYLFHTSDGGATWTQEAKLTEDDSALVFGYFIALHDDVLAVSHPRKLGGDSTEAGCLHIYRRSNGEWPRWTSLRSEADKPFQVALTDGALAVASDAVAYVYSNVDGTWVEAERHTFEAQSVSAAIGSSGYAAFGLHGASQDFAGSVAVYVPLAPLANPEVVAAFDGVGAGDRFGSSVALSRELVVIGARGYVSLYKCENQTHVPLTVLYGAGDFGASVAVDGVVVVGAPSENQVVVYHANGTLMTTLTANDASNLGASVAIHGSIIVAGSDEDDEQRGAVYMWRDYEFIGRLQAHDAQPGDRLGFAVAATASLIAAGAPHRRGSGAVVVFDTEGDIKADFGMGSIGDGFGSSVAVEDTTIIIGAPGNDAKGSNAGAAYAFDCPANANCTGRELIADPLEAGDWFGTSVALARGAVVVGAAGRDEGGSNAGAALVFRRSGAEYVAGATLTETDPEADDGFGGAVAAFGNRVVVGGSQLYDGGAGFARVFKDVAATAAPHALGPLWAPEDGLSATARPSTSPAPRPTSSESSNGGSDMAGADVAAAAALGAAAAGGFLLLGVGVGLCAWRRRRRAPVWLADDWKDPPVEVTFSDSELEEDCVV